MSLSKSVFPLFITIILSFSLLSSTLSAGKGDKTHSDGSGNSSAKRKVGDYVDIETLAEKRALSMLAELRKDNDKFVKDHDRSYFEGFIDSQHPRVTFVTCVDSRVHTHAFDSTPDNDIFMIRNLSGQYKAGAAGIHYGVLSLGTPLVIFMGHDGCGAVTEATKAGASTKAKDEGTDPIKRELANIKILQGAKEKHKDGKDNTSFKEIVHTNTKFNTHAQIDDFLKATDKPSGKTFFERVKEGNLTVVGALYDFANTESGEYGRLHLIDVRDKEWAENHTEGTSSTEPAPASHKALTEGAASEEVKRYKLLETIQQAIRRLNDRLVKIGSDQVPGLGSFAE